MPPANATPLSQRSASLQRQPSPFDDTPTRPPSSGHSSLNPLTSLKPRTRPAPAFVGLRTASTNTLDTHHHHRTASRLSKASDFPDDLDPIEADNTEIQRRRVEASFQRQLDSLANAALSVSSATDDDAAPPRRRFDDESLSTRSSASRSSADSLGSLRIGLTGTAPLGTARGGVTIEDVPEDGDESDDHLTYVTERTSVLDSPARPVPAARSPVRASAPAASSGGGLFGSPRPSVLAHLQAAGAASPLRRAAPAPANENLPPSPVAAATRPSSFAAPRAASYPSVAPPRTVAPPLSSFARSPFSAAATTAHAPKHYSPLNPALNSPINASPSASTAVYSRTRDDDRDHVADRTARTALPDRTGLTEMLRSPQARRAPQQIARRTSPVGSGSASGKSAEANLVSTALAGLTSKLSTLERENAHSAARVAELEARLAARSSGRSAAEDEQAGFRAEVEGLLREERDRRNELERVVQSLRAQNAHLDATLSAQHATLASLRAAPTPAPAPAQPQREYALRTEVQDLKHALAALGYEVDGVRTVVEELLRDKETRDAARRWDVEEAERRAALDENVLSVPGTPREESGEGRSSTVSEGEVRRLVKEQEEELHRRAQRKAKHAPRTQALSLSHDSTYVPSESGSHSSGSLVSATSATSLGDSLSSREPEPEPDFARAERIFNSVSPPWHRRAPRRNAAAGKGDRVLLADEPSANLCANCHSRKSALRTAAREVDGTDADAEDLAPGEEARARAKRERRRVKEAAEREQERERAAKEAEAEKAKVQERERERRAREKRVREREEHRRTLEGVLDRLEGDFAAQKKIYLELTAEYQGMASRADTRKRRVLASHLKQSIDVLEDKAREVKRYADALDDLYEATHDKTCPRRKTHAVV